MPSSARDGRRLPSACRDGRTTRSRTAGIPLARVFCVNSRRQLLPTLPARHGPLASLSLTTATLCSRRRAMRAERVQSSSSSSPWRRMTCPSPFPFSSALPPRWHPRTAATGACSACRVRACRLCRRRRAIPRARADRSSRAHLGKRPRQPRAGHVTRQRQRSSVQMAHPTPIRSGSGRGRPRMVCTPHQCLRAQPVRLARRLPAQPRRRAVAWSAMRRRRRKQCAVRRWPRA
mmetsp:Transcript_64661/g.127790  ORF Transcript_64661/g.127790 Transcript_64661/m.127790 type:complete len:233 (+) Transcript_64661:625-1323(+)